MCVCVWCRKEMRIRIVLQDFREMNLTPQPYHCQSWPANLVLYNINERNVFRYLLTVKPNVCSFIVLEITSEVNLNKSTKKRDND